MKLIGTVFSVLVLCSSVVHVNAAQPAGTIEGTVILPTGDPAHRITVLLAELGRIVETDDDGRFVFENVPPGAYDILAFQSMLNSELPGYRGGRGADSFRVVELRISPLRQEITVTARGPRRDHLPGGAFGHQSGFVRSGRGHGPFTGRSARRSTGDCQTQLRQRQRASGGPGFRRRPGPGDAGRGRGRVAGIPIRRSRRAHRCRQRGTDRSGQGAGHAPIRKQRDRWRGQCRQQSPGSA